MKQVDRHLHNPISNHTSLTCSIVIRAYNEQKHIGRLLDGIAQQTVKNLEVILVDSGSTDNTVAVSTSYAQHFPVHVVRIQPNQFTFGHALNQGIEHSSSDLIVIASAHVYPVYPDWLENLMAPFSDPKVVLSYGKQRGNDSTKFSEHQIFSRWYPEESQTNQSTPFCNNANAAIRRITWDEHPYDESLSGLEDLAWAHWAVEQGYAIAYNAEAEVVHVHEESPQAVYNRYRREAMAFKRIFPQEYFGRRDFLRLVTTNIASDLYNAARQKQLAHNLSSIFWFRWMQFRGTYQGFRHAGPLTWQLRQTFYYPGGTAKAGQSAPREVQPIRYNE
jgi:glycosyltransferase involved in cell wall biosynthesis